VWCKNGACISTSCSIMVDPNLYESVERGNERKSEDGFRKT
jgi:hypothetical protein